MFKWRPPPTRTSALRLLLLLFLAVPLVEIYVLIEVGSVLGAAAAIGLVVLTAAAGAALMRAQGLATVLRARAAMARGEVPAFELLEGAVILVSGALLLIPGFLTDAAGFVCLIPAVRRRLILAVASRPAGPRAPSADPDRSRRTRVLEGEFRREDGRDP